jgi:Uma2 family endonuclease
VTLAEKHLGELPRRRRWSREMYYRAVDAGVFGEDDRIELIGGEIVEQMAPQKSTYSWAVSATEKQLSHVFGNGYWVRVQMPLSLGLDSDPEPDVSVVAGDMDLYKAHHPAAAVLVVEVSDASIQYDRRIKSSLYAAASIPEYWIVNLSDAMVEVYRDPVADLNESFGSRYNTMLMLRYGKDDSITLRAVGGHSIPVAKLLP